MARTQYRSQASADIRELLTQLNEAKILPYGYPRQLAEKANCTLGAARQTVVGRSANIKIVETLVKDAEKIIGVKVSKPPKLDFSHLTLTQIIEEKLLPNRYGELAAEITGLSPNTIQQIKSGLGTSQNVEVALRELASRNLELELKHRLEKIFEAMEGENPAVS